MNLKQLEAYLWVAKLGSFSKTAERLYTTQPAISSRITNLEDELGVALFDRAGGLVRPTSAGYALLPLARQALGAVEAMRERTGAPSQITGPLRLGVSETIVHMWLPDLLARLRETYPALDVEISIDVSGSLGHDLLDHSLDLAFLMGPLLELNVDNVMLGSYPLIWAMRPETSGAKIVKMTMTEMLRYPLLTYARNTRIYAEIHETFRNRTGEAPRMFPSSSLSGCQRMAERGIGIGTLPRTVIAEALAEGRLVEVETDWCPAALNYTASFVRDSSRPVIARIAEMAREVAQSA